MRRIAPGSGALATTGFGGSAQPTDGWFDRPMRWVQLTLVENDPGRFDPQFWIDYFRRLHADAATLSAGGTVSVLSGGVDSASTLAAGTLDVLSGGTASSGGSPTSSSPTW